VIFLGYGFTLTAAGRNLLMRLQTGDTLAISRIMVGSGILDGGTDPDYLTDLINPVTFAASTAPVVKDNVLSMTIEYRNDMNGGLTENFWLSEYGIFAKDSSGSEILLYYADLSELPEPVIAWNSGRTPVMKRYPVEIILVTDNVNVTLNFDADAFVIHEDLIPMLNDIEDLKAHLQSLTGIKISGIVQKYADLPDSSGITNSELYLVRTDETHDGKSTIYESIDSEWEFFSEFAIPIDDIYNKLGEKVDKVSGFGLSSNDYTTAEKNKLAGISANVEISSY
jgi:hypothetical protein